MQTFRQSFFRQCLTVALFAKLFDRQSFLLYGTYFSLYKRRFSFLQAENTDFFTCIWLPITTDNNNNNSNTNIYNLLIGSNWQ